MYRLQAVRKTILCAFLTLALVFPLLNPVVSLAESTGVTTAKVVLRKSDSKDPKHCKPCP